MPAGALLQPLAFSIPLSTAQLPFPLFINGMELSGGSVPERPGGRAVTGADATTYALKDPGFSGNQTMDFVIHDHTNAVWPWIAKQMRVLWLDAAANLVLFQGFIKELHAFPVAAWVDIEVTCSHISECLDFGMPINTWDAGAHGRSDRAEIQALIAAACSEPNVGCGGNIALLNPSMPLSTPTERTTLRNAAETVLAATGIAGAVISVDSLGHAFTLTTSGWGAAPYAITDAPGPWTTAVPAKVDIDVQGATDVDALWINGATPAATGAVYAWSCGFTSPPRSPMRWDSLDAPQATDRASAIAAATAEFQNRCNAVVVTIVVTGYDGWQKGQLITVTNGPLGLSGAQYVITAVDMVPATADGKRQYTLTAGAIPAATPPRLFTAALKKAHAKTRRRPHHASKGRGAVVPVSPQLLGVNVL